MTNCESDKRIMDMSRDEILAMDINSELKLEIMLQYEIVHKTLCATCSSRGEFNGRVYHCYRSEVDAGFVLQIGDLVDEKETLLGNYVQTCPQYKEEDD